MSTPAPHPRDAEALEYVLGTQSGPERRLFEAALASDPSLAEAVLGWQEHLAPLATFTPVVHPSPGLRSRIEAAIRGGAAAPSGELERLRRSRGLWRATSLAATALAAGLALWIAVPPPAPTSQLVAVVNRAGDLPALIVRVDPRSRIVSVRSVAPEVPPGRSLELWSVAGATPRSLGLVPQGGTRVSLSAGADPLADGVTLAVSLEPPGGSPTGAPTGPVVYSGRLIADAP